MQRSNARNSSKTKKPPLQEKGQNGKEEKKKLTKSELFKLRMKQRQEENAPVVSKAEMDELKKLREFNNQMKENREKQYEQQTTAKGLTSEGVGECMTKPKEITELMVSQQISSPRRKYQEAQNFDQIMNGSEPIVDHHGEQQIQMEHGSAPHQFDQNQGQYQNQTLYNEDGVPIKETTMARELRMQIEERDRIRKEQENPRGRSKNRPGDVMRGQGPPQAHDQNQQDFNQPGPPVRQETEHARALRMQIEERNKIRNYEQQKELYQMHRHGSFENIKIFPQDAQPETLTGSYGRRGGLPLTGSYGQLPQYPQDHTDPYGPKYGQNGLPLSPQQTLAQLEQELAQKKRDLEADRKRQKREQFQQGIEEQLQEKKRKLELEREIEQMERAKYEAKMKKDQDQIYSAYKKDLDRAIDGKGKGSYEIPAEELMDENKRIAFEKKEKKRMQDEEERKKDEWFNKLMDKQAKEMELEKAGMSLQQIKDITNAEPQEGTDQPSGPGVESNGQNVSGAAQSFNNQGPSVNQSVQNIPGLGGVGNIPANASITGAQLQQILGGIAQGQMMGGGLGGFGNGMGMGLNVGMIPQPGMGDNIQLMALMQQYQQNQMTIQHMMGMNGSSQQMNQLTGMVKNLVMEQQQLKNQIQAQNQGQTLNGDFFGSEMHTRYGNGNNAMKPPRQGNIRPPLHGGPTRHNTLDAAEQKRRATSTSRILEQNQANDVNMFPAINQRSMQHGQQSPQQPFFSQRLRNTSTNKANQLLSTNGKLSQSANFHQGMLDPEQKQQILDNIQKQRSKLFAKSNTKGGKNLKGTKNMSVQRQTNKFSKSINNFAPRSCSVSNSNAQESKTFYRGSANMINTSYNVGEPQDETVRVVVRCRPMDQKETSEGHGYTIGFSPENKGEIIIYKPTKKSLLGTQTTAMETVDSGTKYGGLTGTKYGGMGEDTQKIFTYDMAYDENSSQEQIYMECAQNMVQQVMEGYNSTIFAYGQTGSGKTYTMTGPEHEDYQDRGIIPRSFDDMFQLAQIMIGGHEDTRIVFKASYMEIYNEQIRDLLSVKPKEKLQLREDPDKGVYVEQITEHIVENNEECFDLLRYGLRNRATASTNMNSVSSRSHALFQVKIERVQTEIVQGGSVERVRLRQSKLNLVDLAGSEKISKTGSEGIRLKEASKINLSLHTLCHVIQALTNPKATHVPYRDSSLTRLLQDSLGGNTKTLMISNISPSDRNFAESISTLRQASRAKKIKNKPRINEDRRDALLREYEEEIAMLRMQLDLCLQSGMPLQDIQNKHMTELEENEQNIQNNLNADLPGALDAQGHLQGHSNFVQGNFNESISRGNSDQLKEQLNGHQQSEFEKKAQISVGFGFFQPPTLSPQKIQVSDQNQDGQLQNSSEFQHQQNDFQQQQMRSYQQQNSNSANDEELERRGDFYQCVSCDQYSVHVSNDTVCQNPGCSTNASRPPQRPPPISQQMSQNGMPLQLQQQMSGGNQTQQQFQPPRLQQQQSTQYNNQGGYSNILQSSAQYTQYNNQPSQQTNWLQPQQTTATSIDIMSNQRGLRTQNIHNDLDAYYPKVVSPLNFGSNNDPDNSMLAYNQQVNHTMDTLDQENKNDIGKFSFIYIIITFINLDQIAALVPGTPLLSQMSSNQYA